MRAASLVGVGGVPLGDASVEIPTVEINALVGFEELGEEFACAAEILSFKVDEAYDHVGDLHAGVVDVVLNAYGEAGFVSVGAEEALEGVTEDGVAEMADMSGFVGIDAGVFDETEAGTADVGVLVCRDLAGDGGAVETDVEVARSGYFDAGDASGSWVESSVASSVAMARGALRRRLASSKATGRASSPRAMVGGCSTTRFVSVMSYLDCRMAWMRANRDCWIVRYMLLGSPGVERVQFTRGVRVRRNSDKRDKN